MSQAPRNQNTDRWPCIMPGAGCGPRSYHRKSARKHYLEFISNRHPRCAHPQAKRVWGATQTQVFQIHASRRWSIRAYTYVNVFFVMMA